MVRAGARCGLGTASEVFADRTYQPDGSLTPRREAHALISEVGIAAERAMRMVTEGRVRAAGGEDIQIQADTICIHGDGAHALEFAREIRKCLQEAGVLVQPVSA